MIARWYQTTFEALGVRDYRVLWWGSTLATLAFMMTRTVQSVVAFDLAGNSTAVGIVALGSGIAMIFIGPLGGVLADRLSKRLVLLFGQSLVGICFATIGVLIITDVIALWMLVALSFVMGISFSFIGPTRQAYVGELVDRDLLPNAVALSQLSQGFSRVVSPMLAGGLIALSVSGTGGTYLVMGAILFAVVGTISMLPASRPASSGKSITGDFTAGLSHVRERPRLLVLILSFVLVVVFGMPYVTVLPALLESELGHSSETIGILFTVEAIGGLVTGLLVAGSVRGAGAARIMFGLGIVFGVALIGLSIVPSLALALVAMFFMGVGLTGFQLTNNALLMMEADQEYFGRVMSLVMIAWGGQGLTALPIGILADRIGERPVLAMEGAVILAIVIGSAFAYSTVGRGASTSSWAAARKTDTEAGGAVAGGS
ncbi:MAG: MFS transporter [Chloroflexi bacterium]|nr:MFS transporter [Chloroflexota bacterium]MDA1145283.1 MFS transporter [Chloroflexota bacterium]